MNGTEYRVLQVKDRRASFYCRLSHAALGLIVTSVLLSCDKGLSGSVNATIPANGATNVSISSALTAMFSEPMDASTVTAATFRLKDSAMNPVSGTVTVSGTTTLFTPLTSLAGSTRYTATLTSGVKGLSGNALAAPYTWSFTTGTLASTMAPTVSHTAPPSGATNVSIFSALTATFSKPVNPATVTAATFTLKDNANNSVTGNMTTNGVTVTFVFSSGTPLKLGTSYTATLTTGIKDLADNALQTNFSWTFTTGAASSTGLVFPFNKDVPNTNADSVRFRWMNPHTNGLPIYGPNGNGVTYIWRVKPVYQAGYYTTMFWANDDGAGNINTFLWAGSRATTYYGAHPYPDGGGNATTTHKWEISIEQDDFVNGVVVYDQWYTQALVAWGAPGVVKQHEFYWDLPNVNARHKVTRTTASPTWGDINPPSPALTFGDAPWQPGNETCSCTLRGLQIYSVKLSESDILREIVSPLSTPAGAAHIWYLNLNPTPDDILDKSGKGHHPSWVGNKRPTLFTE